ALALELLLDEAAHLLGAHAGDQRRFQPQPRRTDSDIGRTAADRLGERSDILEPAANLLAIEIHRRAANGDDIQHRLRHDPHPLDSLRWPLYPIAPMKRQFRNSQVLE